MYRKALNVQRFDISLQIIRMVFGFGEQKCARLFQYEINIIIVVTVCT